MEKSEKKVFRHPSSVSLFNLYDKLPFPTAQGKTVLELIEQKSTLFEWALTESRLFCFDDYTYSHVMATSFHLSDKAIQKQVEKREIYKNATLEFNNKYDGNIQFDLGSAKMKLYKLNYHLGFGNYAEKTVEELIEISPSRIEFYIQSLPWFGLSSSAISKLESIRANFIFLKSTFDLLTIKHRMAPGLMKGGRRVNNDLDDNDHYNDNEPYMIGDPRHDRNENPWIDVFGEGDEAETAYWNTD